jgi:hypothetical protein
VCQGSHSTCLPACRQKDYNEGGDFTFNTPTPGKKRKRESVKEGEGPKESEELEEGEGKAVDIKQEESLDVGERNVAVLKDVS